MDAPPKSIRTILEDLFFEYFWWWMAGFVVFCMGLSVAFSDTKGPVTPKYLTPEERAIRDEVAIQLLVERIDRERKEKFDREYQRQKREGR